VFVARGAVVGLSWTMVSENLGRLFLEQREKLPRSNLRSPVAPLVCYPLGYGGPFTYGEFRNWDVYQVSWPDIETCPATVPSPSDSCFGTNGSNFGPLKMELTALKSAGVNNVMQICRTNRSKYELGRIGILTAPRFRQRSASLDVWS
jgi:hypothetical protein